jgi:penicillin-binding protein 2
VLSALKAVVSEPGGTAYAHRLKDIEVAGKTGTAQVVAMGAERTKTDQQQYWQKDHGWFAAFAPADDPEIVVVVLNEHGGWGSSSAAPTAMAVIQAYFDDKRQREAPPASEAPKSTTPSEAAPVDPATAGKPKLGATEAPEVKAQAAAWN